MHRQIASALSRARRDSGNKNEALTGGTHAVRLPRLEGGDVSRSCCPLPIRAGEHPRAFDDGEHDGRRIGMCRDLLARLDAKYHEADVSAVVNDRHRRLVWARCDSSSRHRSYIVDFHESPTSWGDATKTPGPGGNPDLQLMIPEAARNVRAAPAHDPCTALPDRNPPSIRTDVPHHRRRPAHPD